MHQPSIQHFDPLSGNVRTPQLSNHPGRSDALIGKPTMTEGQEILTEGNCPSSHEIARSSNVELKTLKSEKIEREMKSIGFGMPGSCKDKNQFSKNLSNVLANFFNPLINDIAAKEKKLCEKLGYAIEKEEEHTERNKHEEEAKIESISKKVQIKPTTQQKSLTAEQEKRLLIEQIKASQRRLMELEGNNEPEIKSSNKTLKRRIIRRVVRKGQTPVEIKRNNEEKLLVKQMEKNFDCKLKNNRLYIKGMPKKPVSSFFFFFKEYSKKVHEQNQQLEVSKELTYGSALAKRISKRWQEMTPQEKIPYKKMSMITRQDYQRRMDEFKRQNSALFDSFKKIKRVKANETRRIKLQKDSLEMRGEGYEMIEEEENSQQGQNNLQASKHNRDHKGKTQTINLDQQLQIVIPQKEKSSSSTTQRGSGTVSNSRAGRNLRQRFKSDHKPKSPSPSFFFFYNQKKAQISKQHNVIRGAKITQIASGMWKQMSDQDKRPYETLADERRKQYYEDMKKWEADYPEEWARMQEYRKRASAGYGRNRGGNTDKGKIVEESVEDVQNSESQQNEDSAEIDSLDGTTVKKKLKTTQEKPRQFVKPLQKSETGKSSSFKPIIIEEKIHEEYSIPESKFVSNSSKRAKSSQQKAQEPKKESSRQDSIEISHKPKAPISSFFLFYRESMATLSEQFQETNGGKLVQYASQIWKQMSATQKAPYETQAEESRKNYYIEMNEYKEKYPEEVKQNLKRKQQRARLAAESGSSSPSNKRKRNNSNSRNQTETKQENTGPTDKTEEEKTQQTNIGL